MNIWSEAKQIVGTVAPALAALLGGPLAGTAVGEIVKVLGLSSSASAADVTSALKVATPDQLIALKQADQAFQVQLKQIDIEWEKLADDDRASARGRQTAEHDPIPAYMGAVILATFILTVGTVLTGHSKADSVLAGTIIGYVVSQVQQVTAYYFGSSAGSKAKDAMLYASQPAEPTPKVPENAA